MDNKEKPVYSELAQLLNFNAQIDKDIADAKLWDALFYNPQAKNLTVDGITGIKPSEILLDENSFSKANVEELLTLLTASDSVEGSIKEQIKKL